MQDERPPLPAQLARLQDRHLGLQYAVEKTSKELIATSATLAELRHRLRAAEESTRAHTRDTAHGLACDVSCVSLVCASVRVLSGEDPSVVRRATRQHPCCRGGTHTADSASCNQELIPFNHTSSRHGKNRKIRDCHTRTIHQPTTI